MSDIPSRQGHVPEKRQSIRPPHHLVMAAARELAVLLVGFAAVFYFSHDKPVCPVKNTGQSEQKVDKTCRCLPVAHDLAACWSPPPGTEGRDEMGDLLSPNVGATGHLVRPGPGAARSRPAGRREHRRLDILSCRWQSSAAPDSCRRCIREGGSLCAVVSHAAPAAGPAIRGAVGTSSRS